AFVVLQDPHANVGALMNAQRVELMDVRLLHAPFLDGDFLHQRGGKAVDDPALDLRFNTADVDRPPAIDDAMNAFDFDLFAFQGHVHNHADIRAEILPVGHSPPVDAVGFSCPS